MVVFFAALPAWSAVKNSKQTERKTPPTLQEVEECVKAKAVLLVDAATNKVLFEKNTDMPLPPASTVKLMTALLTYEKLGLNGSIIVSRQDTKVEPSNIPLRTGERVSVSDMMHTLLIGSDNDSALALARKTAGSEGKFVDMMNLRAQQLGCKNTIFANPHGLPDPKHQLTTAHDLLMIFQKVLAIPALREIAQTKEFWLRTRVGLQRVKNHNKLLGKYPGMGPAKTGWTLASKHTYAASATRNGRELHLILLGSPDKWTDARLLFDYGFSHSIDEKTDAITAQTPSAPAPQKNSQPVSYTVRSGDTLSNIGKKYQCSTGEIIRYNQLKNPHQLMPGQILMIPVQN